MVILTGKKSLSKSSANSTGITVAIAFFVVHLSLSPLLCVLGLLLRASGLCGITALRPLIFFDWVILI